MIGQGQNKTRIPTRKKGGPPPHGGPGEKVEGKRERKKREKQARLGGAITSDMRDSSCANIDVNIREDIDVLVG